jgi:CelD/BcsL family acetyltransferase involved in cellulose biosynthesis
VTTALLRVEVVESLDKLVAIEPDWATLESGASIGEWLAGPRYLVPLLKAFFAERPLAVHCAYEGSTLIGVLPLIEGVGGNGSCRPTVGFPVNPHVRRIGLLASRRPTEVMSAILKHANERYGGCVFMQQVETGSPFDSVLTKASGHAGFRSFDIARSSSAVTFWPDGWDAYVSSRDIKLLRNLRSRRRKLDQAGFTVRKVRSAAEFDDAWPMLLDIERRSWKHVKGTSIENEPGTAELYAEIGRRCAMHGSLRLYLLERNGVGVAHTLGVASGGVFYRLKSSYDESLRSWALGTSLAWQTLQDAAEDGIVRYDFMGDATDWKRDFATHETAYVNRRLFSPMALGCRVCEVRENIIKPIARRIGIHTWLKSAGNPVR